MPLNNPENAIVPAVLDSDGAYSGDMTTGVAGEALSKADCAVFNSDEKWVKTNKEAEELCDGQLALAMEDIAQDESGNFFLDGLIRFDSWSWSTSGKRLYVGISGVLIDEVPTVSGEFIRLAGYTKASNTVNFCPRSSLVELL